ncbi:hypothetical protein QBC45DRAFT_340576, partial [Copromyces sp. CBS 386.78]
RVILIKNFWIEGGLINSSIIKIPPFVLLIHFNNYCGPPYFEDNIDFDPYIIPIFRSIREF